MKPGPKPVPKPVLAARGSWRAKLPEPATNPFIPEPPLPPPQHLSMAMKKWWKTVTADYHFNASEYVLLRHACEQYDLAEQARLVLRQAGLTVVNAQGICRAHPCTAIARDARAAYARLVKQLGLES